MFVIFSLLQRVLLLSTGNRTESPPQQNKVKSWVVKSTGSNRYPDDTYIDYFSLYPYIGVHEFFKNVIYLVDEAFFSLLPTFRSTYITRFGFGDWVYLDWRLTGMYVAITIILIYLVYLIVCIIYQPLSLREILKADLALNVRKLFSE